MYWENRVGVNERSPGYLRMARRTRRELPLSIVVDNLYGAEILAIRSGAQLSVSCYHAARVDDR